MTIDNNNKTAIMETSSGKMIDILHPDAELISITDIAHSLANQCRYGGHAKRFLSVAEHSVKVAKALEYHFYGTLPHPPESDSLVFKLVLMALLHDASEAYLVDIPTPIKVLLADYKAIESNLMDEIFKKFGLHSVSTFAEMSQDIHWADKYILFQEAIDAVPSGGLSWSSYKDMSDGIYPPIFRPRYWGPRRAKRIFLREFRKLTDTMTWGDRLLYTIGAFWL